MIIPLLYKNLSKFPVSNLMYKLVQNRAVFFLERITLTHSLDRSAWPATGRCALQTSRSLAVSQAASTASPSSTSSWRIHVCRGRPRGRFHSDLTSGRWPARVLTARRSVSCAGTVVLYQGYKNNENMLWRLLNADTDVGSSLELRLSFRLVF